MIDRRHALERLSLILGGTLSPQLTAAVQGQVLNDGDSLEIGPGREALLAEVADVIIPETDTPGAKEAGAHRFIIRVMRDCYVLEEQETFYAGLDRIEQAASAAHGKPFVELGRETQAALVEEAARKDKPFFREMKRLTVTGYFTSEIGATEALEYLPIPGRFDGDVPLQPSQKAWAISR